MLLRSLIALFILGLSVSPLAAKTERTVPMPSPSTKHTVPMPSPPEHDVPAKSKYSPRITNQKSDNTRKLLPGDHIRFLIHESEGLSPSQIHRVKENGTVDFPYIGHVFVEGYTPKQVADVLKVELEKKFYYRATIFIGVEKPATVRGGVYVMGEVEHQGEINLPANKDFRLSHAIFKARITKYSRLNKVKVIRQNADGTEDTVIIDARPIFEDGSKENDIILRGGDKVIIGRRGGDL